MSSAWIVVIYLVGILAAATVPTCIYIIVMRLRHPEWWQ